MEADGITRVYRNRTGDFGTDNMPYVLPIFPEFKGFLMAKRAQEVIDRVDVIVFETTGFGTVNRDFRFVEDGQEVTPPETRWRRHEDVVEIAERHLGRTGLTIMTEDSSTRVPVASIMSSSSPVR